MRALLVLLAIIFFSSCGDDFDPGTMFGLRVIPARPGEVRSLKGGRVSCMHCPLYFAFETKDSLTERIISEHHLQPTPVMPQEARQVIELVSREATWWEMRNPMPSDKMFWMFQEFKQPGPEPRLRFFIIRGNRSFFITSG